MDREWEGKKEERSAGSVGVETGEGKSDERQSSRY